MRKDVKFALVIGGVFLAVLIVYISVMQPDRGHANDVALVGPDGNTLPADAAPAAPTITPPAPSNIHPRPATPAAPAASDKPKPAAATPKSDLPEHTVKAPVGQPVRVQLTPSPLAVPAADTSTDPWQRALSSGMLDAVKPAVDIQPDNSTDTLPDVAPIRTETPGPDQTGTPIMADAQPMQPPAQPQPTETPLQPTQVVTPAAVAPTTHPAVVANTGARTHVVAAGETFSSIAQSVYGASKYWNRIADANPNINPKSLHPGMILIIPGFSAPVEPAPSAPVAAAPAPIDPKTEYRVQPGDSLYKIAVHIYTNGNYAQKIYDLNKALIGADPAKLKVGQVLKLPAAPAPAAAAPAASH